MVAVFSTSAAAVARAVEEHADQGKLEEARPLVAQLGTMTQELARLVGSRLTGADAGTAGTRLDSGRPAVIVLPFRLHPEEGGPTMTPGRSFPRAWLVAVTAWAAAGCSNIAVERNRMPDLFDGWRASAVLGDGLSPRTLQALRQRDLVSLYQRDPAQAVARLHAEAVKEPQPDLLFALAEINYLRGRAADKWDRGAAIGYYYLCAGYAYHYLFGDKPGENPGDRAAAGYSTVEIFDPHFRLACDLYNAGLAKCINAAQKVGRLDPRQQMQLPTPDGEPFTLSVVHAGFAWKPEEFGPLLFCEDYTVKGLVNQHRTYGLGVPLIATRAISAPDPRDAHYPRGVSFPVTAFFRFEGGLADLGARRVGRLELYNPLAYQSIQVRGRQVPLETDLTTPLAYFLAHTDLDNIEYTAFLRADKILDRTGIYLLEPYQPGKIPVLMVHGLLSSPLTWAPLFNDLRADPVLRERYQFWFYFYPTGDPYPLTAADLRRELAQLRTDLDPEHRDPAFDRMVLVGHSMGGLVSHLLTVDSGNEFWHQVSNKPLASLKLEPETREELQRIFFFRRESCVERVIFLGTPHHGSRLSPSPVGRLAVHLVQLPRSLLKITKDLAAENPDLPEAIRKGTIPTSVDLLAPGTPELELLAARPRPVGVRYHSVVGIAPPNTAVVERFLAGAGRCDESDGVVPYQSAHLDAAESELVVPADHYHVHQHPLTVLEVRRILRAHLDEPPPAEIIPAGISHAGTATDTPATERAGPPTPP
jgi:pimeloyl-ACP methyl ester carboxylesterase